MNSNIKKLIWFLFIVLALTYIGGLIFFSMNTFPNTSVNGVDRSLSDKELIFEPSKDFDKIRIEGRDKLSFDIVLRDIDFSRSVVGKPEHNQNPLLWPIEVFRKHNYEIEFKNKFNKKKLDEIIANSGVLTNQVKPENATIIFDKNSKEFTIKPEVLGTSISEEKLKQAILTSINSSQEKLNLEDHYEIPKITSKDDKLLKELENIKKVTSKKYIFDFEDRKYTLTGQELFDLYEATDKGLVLNKEKVSDYVAEIAKETDTYGTRRKFKATGLGEITVEPGIYGWLMDVKETSNNLVSMINESKEGPVEVEYLSTEYFAYTAMSRKKDDIGDTYIEIDLSRQHLWYYENGDLIVSTPIVSGMSTTKDSNGFRKAATPVGVNKVWVKESPSVLKGINETTGQRYSLPIDYWIYMGWTGSGIHDTKDRPSYGGSVYHYNGSSSCINTPIDAMAKLYEHVRYETPVVIYESTTSYSPTEFEKQEYNRQRGVY